MSEAIPQDLSKKLKRAGHEHLLSWWESLEVSEQRSLVDQLQQVDCELVNELFSRDQSDRVHAVDDSSPEEIAKRVQPPNPLVRLPAGDGDTDEWQAATRHGRQLLASAKVGVILVAGGQGTRLGFPHPKGMYPIGPVSGASLFELFAAQVRARSQELSVAIPYYIMTSDATHGESVAFFEQHSFFGLDPRQVRFFQQGSMPAVDLRTGRMLLETRSRLCTSPDGHGGLLAALASAGLIDDLQSRGIEYLYYHQVDNPTAIVCDPALIGFHALQGSEMTTKVVAKRDAQEKMGVVVNVDGQTRIIEYSDLPDEQAGATDQSGQLKFWAGNTAIHVFTTNFLSRVLSDDSALPFHLARKQVACIDEQGASVNPVAENAIKFERFIFDALPLAKRALVVEADRAREFNPVKNREGHDSPNTARQALTKVFADWLRRAGAEFPVNATIEISPCYALDADELAQKIEPGTQFSSSTIVLSPDA